MGMDGVRVGRCIDNNASKTDVGDLSDLMIIFYILRCYGHPIGAKEERALVQVHLFSRQLSSLIVVYI